MTVADDIIARLFVRADWMTDAACKGMGPDLFFPQQGNRGIEAKKVCAKCPVAEQCEQHALENRERHGIWGGYSIDRRIRAVRNPRPRTSPGSGGQTKPIAHGTLAGYQQERRRGIMPCDDCRNARNAHRQAIRAEHGWDAA
jgi:WhiB family redox-sensing transcriptional regulator